MFLPIGADVALPYHHCTAITHEHNIARFSWGWIIIYDFHCTAKLCLTKFNMFISYFIFLFPGLTWCICSMSPGCLIYIHHYNILTWPVLCQRNDLSIVVKILTMMETSKFPIHPFPYSLKYLNCVFPFVLVFSDILSTACLNFDFWLVAPNTIKFKVFASSKQLKPCCAELCGARQLATSGLALIPTIFASLQSFCAQSK